MRSTGEVMGSSRRVRRWPSPRRRSARAPASPSRERRFCRSTTTTRTNLLPIAREPGRVWDSSSSPPKGPPKSLHAAGIRLQDGLQGSGGAAQRRGPDEERRDRPDPQHTAGPGLVLRRKGAAGGPPRSDGIPLVTTLSGGHAMVQAIIALRKGRLDVRALQEIYD